MSRPEVIAVFGPTASGKTAIAEALADALTTDVVSADAMQMYEGLRILTNQPSRPTRLVAVWPLEHEGSVAEFACMAHAAIDELVDTSGTAVVAGGTGLYLRAALADLGVPPRADPDVRAHWETAYDTDPEAAYVHLESRDRAAAALVHPNDRRRVVRALELADAGASLAPDEDRLWAARTRRSTLIVGLDLPRHVLERRIEERTDQMFREGVIEEVRTALGAGVSRTVAKALGLREISDLPPEDARDAIVRRTLRYAAYQRKWMRRIPGIVMIDSGRSPREVADEILEVARAG